MHEEFGSVYKALRAWCRARDYAGHDPFDALNSRLFQSTPLRRSRLARLAWTQVFKRSPVNLRRPARVPVGRNAKGTALFALAALSRFRVTRKEEDEREARSLLDDLLDAKMETTSGAAWGYNFDWQGRAFYAPKGTPTVVPTAFAVRALTEAITTLNTSREEDTLSSDVWKYLTAATRACRFILEDLNRSDESDEEVCFSYTPLDRTRVFNASLLAGEALASVGAITGPRHWTDYALRAARHVVRGQREDGSWAYGADSYQSWSDNFHTAFVLTSLARILRACESQLEADVATCNEIRRAITRGYAFWRSSFFLADGWPKYYHRSSHPADAHSAGAALVALVELRDIEPDTLELAARVAGWTLRELYDPRGFFYYQKRRLYTVRTPYMRWSQAWMMYGLARMLEVDGRQ
ncbi:MAG: hypothetical protein QOC99_806 [Acidobacteriota bacterium]|jgi:hypothetical protein|nr:hypothetical protein [Acidobacteriota bacterium]